VNKRLISHYFDAFAIRRKAHEMLAIFGGKMPHNVGVTPGGVAQVPSVERMVSFLWRLNEIREFIDGTYIPDVLSVAMSYPDYFEIGAGCWKLLAYGAFKERGGEKRLFARGIVSFDLKLEDVDPAEISEDVKYSWYDDSCGGRHPNEGKTLPEWGKEGAYSWLKSPRYKGEVHEVGPLARVLVNYVKGNLRTREVVDSALAELGIEPKALFSVIGRHIARALDCKLVADAMAEWVPKLKPGEPACVELALPEEGKGMGLIEAPRGALGHWVEIKGGKIANYQCVVPTTWNASPRDSKGKPGPIEQAIEGTSIKDKSPLEIVRIVRSFDPYVACAVHLITPRGRSLGGFRVM
jgi:hydrogenase large subunit